MRTKVECTFDTLLFFGLFISLTCDFLDIFFFVVEFLPSFCSASFLDWLIDLLID